MCPCAADDRAKTSDSPTFLRRFTGPEAHELFGVFRPERTPASVSRQAEAVYGAISAELVAEGASFDDLVCETLFFRDIRQDLSALLDARRRVLGDANLASLHPLTTFVEQPPLDESAPFELSMSAVIPRQRWTASAAEVRGTPRCGCEACSLSGGRLVNLGDQTSLHAGNIHGLGGNAFDEAYDMFCSAESLLERAGMSFRDVLRTWIYLRDIDRDYEALNQARRQFFRHRGIELRPASTGVGAGFFSGAHNVSMKLYAVRSPRPLEVDLMSASSLGEAWEYGADFSRGLRVVEANKIALYIAGTASIDEAGRTVHAGEFESQVDRMLMNISSLLGAQGASFRDVMSAVTYLKRPRDGARLRAVFRDHGFDGFPTTLVAAPLCRPDLLCETEVVAALPLPHATA